MYAYENIEMTLHYIEQHLHEKIETKTLAKIAALSPFYYQRLFKRLIKKSVQEYIKLRRLAMVITELHTSKKRIIDIALSYGFSDHANFTRAFKAAYHITPIEYRKNHPMLNTFEKPELSSFYSKMTDNIPLIVGNMVLEIQQKTLRSHEQYYGLETNIAIAQQIPLGKNTGIDVPGQLWKEFHELKSQSTHLDFNNSIELGVSHFANPEKGTFRYFAGGLVQSTNANLNNMVQYTLSPGTYIVCRIEAESFEELVTTALNQANTFLFENWLPSHHLVTKPYMVERYYKPHATLHTMEIWVMPVAINTDNEHTISRSHSL